MTVDEQRSQGATNSLKLKIAALAKQRNNQIVAGVSLAILIGICAALFANSGESTPTDATEPATLTTESTLPTTTVFAGPFAPLTGLADPQGETLSRAALTVKVDNTLAQGPKRGVDLADVVYEEVVEGGYTRLAAIFHSQVPTDVGPIRSVRLTDQAIVRPIGGLFVFSGGAPYALNSIETAPVVRIDETHAGSAMYRDPDRKAPWNLFGRGSELFAFGGTPTPPPAIFEYRRDGQVAPGRSIVSAHVGFKSGLDVTWTWDGQSGRWHRTFLGAQEFVDSGAPIAPANVIVQFVDYTITSGKYPEAQLVGDGTVWVLSDGKAVEGRWSRQDSSAAGTLIDLAGRPIRLSSGQTWVCLPENGYEFTIA